MLMHPAIYSVVSCLFFITGELDLEILEQCHLIGLQAILAGHKHLTVHFFQVTGVVTDKDGVARWVLSGTWDARIEAARVIGSHGSVKGKPLLETTTPRTLWKRNMPG